MAKDCVKKDSAFAGAYAAFGQDKEPGFDDSGP